MFVTLMFIPESLTISYLSIIQVAEIKTNQCCGAGLYHRTFGSDRKILGLQRPAWYPLATFDVASAIEALNF